MWTGLEILGIVGCGDRGRVGVGPGVLDLLWWRGLALGTLQPTSVPLPHKDSPTLRHLRLSSFLSRPRHQEVKKQ